MVCTLKGTSKRLDTELIKSILIIKGHENSLLAVEAFLKNRDWKIYSCTSMKDALVHIVNSQPTFVLISIDHPHKKVQNLPKILTAAFPVCVVMFGESTSPASYRNLSANPAEYKLFPPVSGPAVERIVNKYLKDRAHKSTEANIRSRESSSDDSEGGVISIRGSSGSNSEGNSYSSSAAQQLLKSMLTGSDTHGEETVGHLAQNKYDPDEEGFLNGSGENKNQGDQSKGQWAPIEAPLTKQQGVGQGDEHSNRSQTGPGKAHMEKEGAGASDLLSAKENGQLAAALSSQQEKNPDQIGTAEKPNPQYQESDIPNSGFKSRKDSPQADEKSSRRAVDITNSSKDRDHSMDDADTRSTNKHFKYDREKVTLIAQGTSEALEQSSIYVQGKPGEKVTDSSHVACIVIDSTRFSGYLVAAMGKNRRIDAEFIEKIRQRLFKFLSENGEQLGEDEKSLNIKIKQVDFQEWAVDCAEFLRKSIHNGDEVAMAFFPHQEAKTKSGKSAEEHMATVSIDDVKADVKLDFNVYVYLPKNGKYVMFTPEGGTLYSKQKDKLKDQGVTELHIRKDDLQRISGHRAQTYLNEQIDRFESNKDLKKKVEKTKKLA